MLPAAAALVASGTLTPAPAAADQVNQTLLGGVAIDGYDPVAYFTQGAPVEGSSAHAFDWNGAEWRFASADHLEMFKADPEKYAPAYGGYCAWAVSQGYTASIDPEAWKIVDGSLYLNYNREIQKRWETDISGFIEAANANWPKIKSEL
ncbi:MAG: YHS domain-containing (seleno)protein [Marivibrio sp.]|uniref:YHS domain-containing (seleno)protein n=1 Tax=Marivibrio sp. TaxID=2039719 RepID=UPI0032ECEB10